jgi:hypothetical protein
MPRAAVSWKKLKKQQPAQPLFPRNLGYKKSISSLKIGKYQANTSRKNRLNQPQNRAGLAYSGAFI